MPFKMISPLSKVATSAIKKLKDLSGDGETTQKDVLIGRGVLNSDGSLANPKKGMSNKIKSSGLKAIGGSTMKSEKSTPLSVSLDKDTTGFYKKLGDATLSAIGSGASSIGSYMMSRAKATSPSGKTKKEKEKEKKDKQREPFYPTPDGKFPIPKSLQIKVGKGGGSSTTTNDKKSTTSGTGGKGSGEKKPEKKTFSQAYEIAKKKYPKTYGKMTLAEYTAEAKKQIANKKKTGKYIGGEKKQTTPEVSVEELKRRKSIQPPPSVQAKGKETKTVKPPETIKKVSTKPKSDSGKKLTPKQRRKAERNIKAQQKANKRIRKAGGQQIKVDEKNVTATAADRRKLTQGAKQLEKKLSLAQKEIDRKNKRKKEKDKKKKGKNSNSTSQLGGFSRVAGR